MAQSPKHRVVVVLATDGLPTECSPQDIPSIAAIASTAAASTPPIRTFVIGVFAPEEAANAQSNLDTLAAVGGTNSAFLINTDQDVTTSFRAALESIRTAALTCEYAIPKLDGGTVDFNKVNVNTPGTGPTTTLQKSGRRTQCAGT